MDSLVKLLLDKGFNVSPAFNTQDYIRFDRTKPMSGWFKGWEVRDEHDKVLCSEARFGDWVTGEKHTWAGGQDKSNLTPEQIAEGNRLRAEAIEFEKAEKLRRQGEAAKEAENLYESATHETKFSHPYVKRKKIDPGQFARALGDKLVIPVYCSEAFTPLTSLQFIAEDGSKKFLSGGRLDRCHSWFLPTKPHTLKDLWTETLYLCEGYATAASVGEAVEQAVMVAFNTSNLVKLCKGFSGSGAYRPKLVVICADNDGATKGNPGMVAAREAQAALIQQGIECRIVAPPCAVDQSWDWNDYHVANGLEKTRIALEGAQNDSGLAPAEPRCEEASTSSVTPAVPSSGALLSMVPPAPEEKQVKVKKEKEPPKKNFEKFAAEWLLGDMGRRLVRQDKALLWYDGQRWVEADSTFIDSIKNKISAYCGDVIDSKKVNSAYNTFFRYVRSVPKGVNLFVPSAVCTNFLDGTLHLRRDLKTNTYTTEFLPHNPEDWLMWVIPVNYKVDRGLRNHLFDTVLVEAFAGDPDGAAKIDSLQEMAGAMLVPAFPQFFFLTGVSGSRKSTIAKTLLKIFQAGGWENVSFVDPSAMENFQIEGMIGKLVNANLDIDDETPLKRGFLKRFEDGLPFQVNRKGKVVINSVLPGVHVYACNHLPPNAEKSRALARRISLIEFKNDLTNDNRAAEIKFYEDVIYAAGPEGILNFALDGLERLLANGGKFRPPPSSQTRLAKWMDEGDATAMFLEAVEHGEVGPKGADLYLHVDQKIERTELGEIFLKFSRSAPNHNVNAVLGRFYTELERRGFKPGKVHGVRYFYGIGVRGAVTGGPGADQGREGQRGMPPSLF